MTTDDQKASLTDMPVQDDDTDVVDEAPAVDSSGPEPDVDEESQEVDAEAVAAVDGHIKMQKEIRSWGVWLLLFGVLHFVGSGLLSAPWGVLLLAVGLSSFYFHEPAMFVVYAVTLAWAAVSNLLGADVTWIVFGLFQIYLAVQVYRKFKQYDVVQTNFRRLVAEDRITAAPERDRAASIFPVSGCLFSALALLGLVALVVFVFGSLLLDLDVPDAVDFFIGLVVNVAVLGLAVGLATIVSHYRHRALAVLGAIASVLVLVMYIAISLWARVS
jgi:hypothetical protein